MQRSWLVLLVVLVVGGCGCGNTGLSGEADVQVDEVIDTADAVDTVEDGEELEDPGPACGNGVVEDGEECDDGSGNSDVNPDACRMDCKLPGCWDGVRDSGESCDGTDLGGETCVGLGTGYTGGILICTPGCELDDGLCSICGNGVIEMHEDCEDDDLGGATCESLGAEGSGLSCGEDCLFDTSGCGWCGNGIVDGVEECDDGNYVLWDGCNGCTVTEFIVNEYMEGSQVRPAVALSDTGDMVVVWQDNSDHGVLDDTYVVAKSIDADGSIITSEWLASAIPGEHPEVAIDGGDRVIVTWHSPHTSLTVRNQCNYYGFYDLAGLLLGDEFQICLSYEVVNHEYADLAATQDGSFLVVWTRTYQEGWATYYDAVGQWFDPAGERIGGIYEFDDLEVQALHTFVSSAADGRNIVVWYDDTQILGTLFDADGAAVSERFQVTAETSFPSDSCIAVSMNDSGDFIVVWSHGLPAGGSDHDIWGRSFDSSAVANGPPFMISTTVEFDQRRVDVGMFPDGRKIVVWESIHQDGDGYGVYGQFLQADDTHIGSEFRLNTITVANQAKPDLDVNPDGNIAVVWESGESHGDIYAQRFDPDGNAIGLQPW